MALASKSFLAELGYRRHISHTLLFDGKFSFLDFLARELIDHRFSVKEAALREQVKTYQAKLNSLARTLEAVNSQQDDPALRRVGRQMIT
jgi:hypothetical protein